jgi:O-antigen/teichoic acid export membrane protein
MIVRRVSEGGLPDGLLWRASLVVTLPTAALGALYALFGEEIAGLSFGDAYLQAGPLLGAMALATLGYVLVAVWMNLYLATRPAPYVLLLAAVALAQNILLAAHHESLSQVVAVFGLTGWTLALAGLPLYLVWLRPRLVGKAA